MTKEEIEKMAEKRFIHSHDHKCAGKDKIGFKLFKNIFEAGANAMQPEMERLKAENAELIERVIQLEKTVDENIESIITNNT